MPESWWDVQGNLPVAGWWVSSRIKPLYTLTACTRPCVGVYLFTGVKYWTEVFPFWTSFCIFLEKYAFFKLTSSYYRWL